MFLLILGTLLQKKYLVQVYEGGLKTYLENVFNFRHEVFTETEIKVLE